MTKTKSVIAVDFQNFDLKSDCYGVIQKTDALLNYLKNEEYLEFIILTSAENHRSLSFLDSPTVSRHCTDSSYVESEDPDQTCTAAFETSTESAEPECTHITLRHKVYERVKNWFLEKAPRRMAEWALAHSAEIQLVKIALCHPVSGFLRPISQKVFPEHIKRKIAELLNKIKVIMFSKKRHVGLEAMLGKKVDAIYYPFPAENYLYANIPVISVISGTLHCFPGVYSEDNRHKIDMITKNLIGLQPTLIADSEYSRKTFLENYSFPDQKIVTVYPPAEVLIKNRIKSTDRDVLQRYGLSNGNYIYYPSDFIQNKNHKCLLIAFSMFCHEHPENTAKLVLSGFSSHSALKWQEDINIMELGDRVVLPGNISSANNSILLHNCRMMLYPSLHEDSAIPILEAVSDNIPVACSDIPVFHEFGGNSAFYFNPYDPAEICTAIDHVLQNSERTKELTSAYSDLPEQFSIREYSVKMAELFRISV